MPEPLITEELSNFLSKNEFVYLATSGSNHQPYVVPKFLIKIFGDYVYLADYVKGTTFRNLKSNPKVSISSTDLDSLIGYQINGVAQILENGPEFIGISGDLEKKKTHFSVERVIKGVQLGKKHENFEVGFPAELAILKIAAKEIVLIEPSGKVQKKHDKKSGTM